MIYLIGGPPRCGKTTVARRLASLVGCPWVQTDYLEAAFSAYSPPRESGPQRLDPGSDVPRSSRNDVLYAKFAAVEIIADYRAVANRTWPGLRALIEYALFDEEDFILEGFHIDPEPVRQFLAADSGLVGNIRPLYLVRQDREDVLASIRRGGHKNDWVLTKTQQEATLGQIARMIVEYGAVVRAEAERAGFPVVNVDGDFDQQVETAVKLLRA